MDDKLDQYHDDPMDLETSSPKPARLKGPLLIGFFGISLTLGLTMAANINLNTGGGVEFGQGTSQVTACDSSVTFTPKATFINAAGGGVHRFSGGELSNIDSRENYCDGVTFTLKAWAYDNSTTPLGAYEFYENAGVFTSVGSSVTSNNSTLQNSRATFTLNDPSVQFLTSEVKAFTLESSKILLGPTDLVANWTFDSDENLKRDNVNNYVLTGTSTFSASGQNGGALSLNGSTALRDTGAGIVGLPIGNSNYTIAAWIRPSIFGGGGIVGWGNYGLVKKVNAFRLNGAGLANYWWGYDIAATIPSAIVDTWYHVAVTYDGSQRIIYLNGTSIASSPSSNNGATASNFAIGVTNGNEYFEGFMDDVAIYKTALTGSQINTLKNSSTGAPRF